MYRLYGFTLQRSSPISESGLLDTMGDFIITACGALAGMFLVSFYKNGKIGKNKKAVRAALLQEAREAELKEKVWEAYPNGQDDHIH